MSIEVFAPAKINLTLHVTGQRDDGYHLLDSLVAFADIGDVIRLEKADEISLTVSGPLAAGVPADQTNLCWRAAELFGEPVAIALEKHLPAAAGIGGGSSDAAAVIRGLERLFNRPAGFDPLCLGADVPVCMLAKTARMTGIGEGVDPVNMPGFDALLVNPGVSVPTGPVFKALASKTNTAMTFLPDHTRSKDWMVWINDQRNDLQPSACAIQPVVADVLKELSALEGVGLVRMSGSGATCVALFERGGLAQAHQSLISKRHPNWWVHSCHLGAVQLR